MQTTIAITDLSHIIDLAVAPVFLLAGIAGFLNVMSGRLGRIVDRARIIERRTLSITDEQLLVKANDELKTLWRRVRLINWSIGLCSSAGLMVCALIVSLFVGGYWSFYIDGLVVFLFVLSLLLLIASLMLLLKEVQLATQLLTFGREIPSGVEKSR